MFEDLEGQWEAQERLEREAEVADRTRRERALVDLGARLAAHRDTVLVLRLVVGDPLTGRLVDLGDGWASLTSGPRSILVPMGAVVSVEGLGARSESATATRRFGLGVVLRGLSRDRAVVTVLDRSGATTTGTIDHVGADHLDLTMHHGDEPRRTANVITRRSIPFGAVVAISG